MPAIHLRVLGRSAVERDGVPIKGRAVQSHHLGLLAFLATAPGRTASRDRLIGCLWPDTDGARARHRLSVALHAIRRGLGKEAILTAGDAAALNPAVVRTDVEDFLDAIDAGRLVEAVTVYEGPFMDGFYLKDGVDFERWVESERERLGARYRSALKRLAEECEASGDVHGIVEWRRRISVEAPYDSAAAVALMEALVASGDLAAAVAHARAYVTRVEADLSIPAHPRVMELADKLSRAAEDRRPGTATVPAASADEPATDPGRATAGQGRTSDRGALVSWAAAGVMAAAAVWAAAGSSPTGEVQALRGGVPSVVVLPFVDVDEDAGTVSMGHRIGEGIGATLAIVPNLDVLEPPPGTLEEAELTDLGRLGRELGARHIVAGSTALDGRRGVVTARIVDVEADEVRYEVTVAKALRSTEALVEALSMAVADSFRVRLARYIPHHYTDSESANEAFLSAVYEHRKMDEERAWVALQHYRRAWEEDPQFALAHAIAGSAYMGLSQNLGLTPDVGWERGREHVMRAIEIDPTLPEAYSVLGRLQLWWDRDAPAAEATLRRAIMLYPTHPDARTWYGYYQLYYLNDFDGAVASMRRALEVDPLNTGRSADVENVLYQTRRFEEVLEQHEHTWSLDTAVAASILNYRAANALREMARYEEAVVRYEKLHDRLGGSIPAGLLVTYARLGRTDEARRLLREREASGGPQTGAFVAGTAQVYAALELTDRAFELLARAVEPDPASFIHMKTSPNFDDFRSDPRFADILRSTGLPPD